MVMRIHSSSILHSAVSRSFFFWEYSVYPSFEFFYNIGRFGAPWEVIDWDLFSEVFVGEVWIVACVGGGVHMVVVGDH